MPNRTHRPRTFRCSNCGLPSQSGYGCVCDDDATTADLVMSLLGFLCLLAVIAAAWVVTS